MDNKELVVDVLKTYGAMTSTQIAVQIFNKKNVSITPAQVAGVLRPLIAKGEAASSKNEYNKNVYWIMKGAC